MKNTQPEKKEICCGLWDPLTSRVALPFSSGTFPR